MKKNKYIDYAHITVIKVIVMYVLIFYTFELHGTLRFQKMLLTALAQDLEVAFFLRMKAIRNKKTFLGTIIMMLILSSYLIYMERAVFLKVLLIQMI